MTTRRGAHPALAVRVLADRAAAALRGVIDRRGRAARGRDGLTGLLDGRALHDALAAAVADAERRGGDVGLLFLDLDRFKRVNDRHGHQAGSRILCQAAALAETAAAEAGGFAARYGGDEFVLVLPETDLDRALERAERLRAAVAEASFASSPIPEPPASVRLTCSIGVASWRRLVGKAPRIRENEAEEDAAARLLRQADDAMYAAKRAGRNRVASTDTDAGDEDALTALDQLQAALRTRSHDLDR